MSEFNIDSIVCHVGKPNPRHEKHGEEDVLAVDVPLRVMEVEDWAKLMQCVWPTRDADGALAYDATRAGETLHSLSAMEIAFVAFAGDNAEHTVNFRQSTKKLVSLTGAKVNKVRLEYGEDLGLTFRVQARCSEDQYKELLLLWGDKYRIELKCTAEATTDEDDEQNELDLEPAEAE